MKRIALVLLIAVIFSGCGSESKNNPTEAQGVLAAPEFTTESPTTTEAPTKSTTEPTTPEPTTEKPTDPPTQGPTTIAPTTAPPTQRPTDPPPTEPPTPAPTDPPPTTEAKEAKLNGFHTITYDNGDKYVGNFVNGIRSGQGTYTWANGITYTGEFVNGDPSGSGNYVYPTETPTQSPATTAAPATEAPTVAPVATQPPPAAEQKQIGGIHKNEKMEIVTPLSAMDKFVVFWGHTGNRVHIKPDCSSFKNGVLFGSLDDARNAGRYEWCGTCSKGYRGEDGYGGDARFLSEGNPNIR